jgi:hypothetical protein
MALLEMLLLLLLLLLTAATWVLNAPTSLGSMAAWVLQVQQQQYKR